MLVIRVLHSVSSLRERVRWTKLNCNLITWSLKYLSSPTVSRFRGEIVTHVIYPNHLRINRPKWKVRVINSQCMLVAPPHINKHSGNPCWIQNRIRARTNRLENVEGSIEIVLRRSCFSEFVKDSSVPSSMCSIQSSWLGPSSYRVESILDAFTFILNQNPLPHAHYSHRLPELVHHCRQVPLTTVVSYCSCTSPFL